MSRRTIQRDGNPIKILRYLVEHDGMSSKELKLALKDIGNDPMDKSLTTLKRRQLVSQKKKGEPYFLTSKGASALRSRDIAAPPIATPMIVMPQKPGAPKNGKVTNGIIKFNRPASMSQTMFSELVSEHSTAERRCEAIENLFQSWPR